MQQHLQEVKRRTAVKRAYDSAVASSKLSSAPPPPPLKDGDKDLTTVLLGWVHKRSGTMRHLWQKRLFELDLSARKILYFKDMEERRQVSACGVVIFVHILFVCLLIFVD
jgi:hypothetical protein